MDKQLTEILTAFIDRLSRNDLDQIKRAADDCWWAAANAGTSSQLESSRQQKALISAVIARMLPTDKETIERIIKGQL